MNKEEMSYSDIVQTLLDMQDNIFNLMDNNKVQDEEQEHMNVAWWELQKAIEITFDKWEKKLVRKPMKE